jgi:hypothetical protein
MLESIKGLSSRQLLFAWLLINVVLASLSTLIMDLINALHAGVFNVYIFFALVLLLVVGNVVLLVGTRTLPFRLLFAISAVWIIFISVTMGTVNTVGVLLNFNLLATSFARLL